MVCFSLPSVTPGAPSAPEVSDVYANKLKLSWQPPSKDGGTPILGYHIERRSNTSRRWVFITKEPVKDTMYQVKDLYVDTTYEFRVSAENKMGTGPPSTPSQAALAKDPWGKPLRVYVMWGTML